MGGGGGGGGAETTRLLGRNNWGVGAKRLGIKFGAKQLAAK